MQESTYTSVNGDPDVTKISNNSKDESTEIEVDKTGRTAKEETHFNLNKLPVDLVTVMGYSEKTVSVYGNDLRNKNPCKMGNVYTFLFYNDQPLICIGPQFVYALILFITLTAINFLLLYFVYPILPEMIKYIGLTVYSLQSITFLFNFLVNPGIPNRKFYISENVIQSIYTYLEYTNSDTFDKYKICKICNIYVPPENTVVHCEDCNICITSKFVLYIFKILDMDHHCTFLGKCVGKKNVIAFNVFIFFTFVFLIFSLLTFITYAMKVIAK